MSINLKHLRASKTLIILFLLLGLCSPVLAHDEENIVAGIISAPVVMNGLVAGEPTELNLIFNADGKGLAGSLDPQEFGYQIPAGGRMEIELSDEFTRNTRFNPETEAVEPVPINPNANLILTIGPQNPIIFQAGDTVARGNWRISDDGANLITLTPNGGTGRNGLENERAKKVGMKVVHIRPNPRTPDGTPFINGDVGEVGTVSIRIYNSHGRLLNAGYANVMFETAVGRQVHNTNAGLRTTPGGSPAVETVEMIDFQRVAPLTALTNATKTTPFSAGAPYAPRFLLFEALKPEARGLLSPDSYIPQAGIANVSYVVDANEPWKAQLVEITDTGPVTIGSIALQGPEGDYRGEILPSPGATGLDGNGSFLTVPVQVGDEEGDYRVTVSLLGGGSATTTIVVDDDLDD